MRTLYAFPCQFIITLIHPKIHGGLLRAPNKSKQNNACFISVPGDRHKCYKEWWERRGQSRQQGHHNLSKTGPRKGLPRERIGLDTWKIRRNQICESGGTASQAEMTARQKPVGRGEGELIERSSTERHTHSQDCAKRSWMKERSPKTEKGWQTEEKWQRSAFERPGKLLPGPRREVCKGWWRYKDTTNPGSIFSGACDVKSQPVNGLLERIQGITKGMKRHASQRVYPDSNWYRHCNLSYNLGSTVFAEKEKKMFSFPILWSLIYQK